jgi:hypothetical protein
MQRQGGKIFSNEQSGIRKLINLESMAMIKYMGTKVTNQNYIHGEIKSRLNLGNACFHAGVNLLFPV